MAVFLYEWAANTGFLVAIMGFLGGAMIALEMLLPKGQISFPVLLRSIGFWCVYLPFAGLLMTILPLFVHAVGLKPLLVIHTGAHSDVPGLKLAAAIFAPVLAIVVADFFDYWMHRAQHRFFWRYHSLHHSIQEISALSGVNHWSEPIFRTVLITLPTIIIGVEQAAVPLVLTAYVWGHGFFVHSACRLHLGPFRRVLVDNRFHRIHHSTNPAHFDKNFATGFTIWDQIFGTAVFPKPDEWPEAGLPDRAPPSSVGRYIAWTFERQSNGPK